jgi:ATP synthase protein I
MLDEPTPGGPKAVPTFAEQIGAKAARKLKARAAELPGGVTTHAGQSPWSGLGAIGIIGWSAAMPMLLGAALGIWLDKRHWTSHSWTPALLLTGLAVGCFNAWRWVSARNREMHQKGDVGNG